MPGNTILPPGYRGFRPNLLGTDATQAGQQQDGTYQPTITEAAPAGIDLSSIGSYIVPVAGAMILSYVGTKIVDHIMAPIEEPQSKMYEDMKEIVKSSKIPKSEHHIRARDERYAREAATERDSDPEDMAWTDHIEEATHHLEAAGQKVRCTRCKDTLFTLQKAVVTEKKAMLSAATKYEAMAELQRRGEIPAGKTWKTLTGAEKKMVRGHAKA